MGRSLRFVPQNHLVEITCRTLHGRCLLCPKSELNEIIIGALGRAQQRFGLRLFGLAVLSNHYHLLAAPDDAKQMADFMCLVNSKIAREVGRLYNWPEKVWGQRYSNTLLAQDDEDYVERLRPKPAFHARNRERRRQLQEAYGLFVKAYRRAAERLRQGDTSVQFPEGSFPPHLPFVRGSPLFDPG